MNRRTFFGTAISTLGILRFSGFFGANSAFAAPKAAAKKGGKVQATEESLKGLPQATGITDANFWKADDAKKLQSVTKFCDPTAKKPDCSPTRQPNQYCGSCAFIQNRVNYNGDVAGKCQLLQDAPPKKLVAGHFHCGSYVNNPQNKYEIKS
jgi:hypothetical protein